MLGILHLIPFKCGSLVTSADQEGGSYAHAIPSPQRGAKGGKNVQFEYYIVYTNVTNNKNSRIRLIQMFIIVDPQGCMKQILRTGGLEVSFFGRRIDKFLFSTGFLRPNNREYHRIAYVYIYTHTRIK